MNSDARQNVSKRAFNGILSKASSSMSQPPIAPAKDVPPLQPSGPQLRRPVTKIGASRKWVLPPRPKPGRKPKQRKDKPIRASPASAEETDCGLCEKDECLCQDIGIKQSPQNFSATSPTPPREMPVEPIVRPRPLAELGTEITLSSIAKDAVPLKRKPNPASKKFMRASVEHMLSPVALKPTYKLKLTNGEGCGFCTANSPCICAEAQEKEEQNAKLETANPPSSEADKNIDYGCATCQEDPMSMLFCLSLSAAQPLPAGSVAIPCTMAYRTIVKHPKFASCDLGQIMMMLESSNKMIGIQSVNRVLQFLNDV